MPLSVLYGSCNTGNVFSTFTQLKLKNYDVGDKSTSVQQWPLIIHVPVWNNEENILTRPGCPSGATGGGKEWETRREKTALAFHASLQFLFPWRKRELRKYVLLLFLLHRASSSPVFLALFLKTVFGPKKVPA
ncbi:Heparan-alpha-glucosaminide N-acetyltransferase [Manis javanica]|nr:Heparan-alpha-glucosaminide N-acetyltransferase [Manis javanica]